MQGLQTLELLPGTEPDVSVHGLQLHEERRK